MTAHVGTHVPLGYDRTRSLVRNPLPNLNAGDGLNRLQAFFNFCRNEGWVEHFNADLLDGRHAEDFLTNPAEDDLDLAGYDIEDAGTVTADDLVIVDDAVIGDDLSVLGDVAVGGSLTATVNITANDFYANYSGYHLRSGSYWGQIINAALGTNRTWTLPDASGTIALTSGIITDHGGLAGLSDDDHTQYHTDARALTWLGTRSTTDLAEGTNLYYTAARFNTAFAAKSTADLAEGANLYFTNARARSALAAGTGLGYDSGTGTFSVTDAELLALLGLTSAANKLPYFTGSGAASTTDFTAFARSLMDDADAATALATLGAAAAADLTSHTSNTSNPHSVTKSQVGLGSVENTALSTWAGTSNLTTLGTITSGVWNGTDIALANIASAASAGYIGATGAGDYVHRTIAQVKSDLSLAALAYLATVSTSQIDDDAVTLAKIANQADATILGNNTGGAASPVALTATQVKALLAIASTDVSGLGTMATAAATDYLSKAGNLSGLANLTTSRSNLGLAIGVDVQAYDAELLALAGLTSAADKIPYFTGAGTASTTDFTSAARSLLDDTSFSAMRTTLGVAIGADVQAYSARLATVATTSLSGKAGYALVVNSGETDYELVAGGGGGGTIDTITGVGIDVDATDPANVVLSLGANAVAFANFVAAASAGFVGATGAGNYAHRTYSQVKSDLDLEVGVDIQAYDADLAALAGVASGADKLPYFTGASTASVTTLTAAARALLDDADAATMRATLGLAALAVLNTVGTSEIDALAVTNAKVATNTLALSKLVTASAGVLMGRRSGSSGNWEEATVGSGLAMSSGGVLSCTVTQGITTPANDTTSSFTIPAVGSTVTSDVRFPAVVEAGALYKITDGSDEIIARVTSKSGSTITWRNMEVVAGAVANTMGSGAIVTPHSTQAERVIVVDAASTPGYQMKAGVLQKYVFDPAYGAASVYLPPIADVWDATLNRSEIVMVKVGSTGGGGNTVSVHADSGDAGATVDGYAPFTLANAYSCVALSTDGANWLVNAGHSGTESY